MSVAERLEEPKSMKSTVGAATLANWFFTSTPWLPAIDTSRSLPTRYRMASASPRSRKFSV